MQSPTDDLDGLYSHSTTQNLGIKLDFSHVKMTETAKICKAQTFFFFKGSLTAELSESIR